jgi:hypothetical protein
MSTLPGFGEGGPQFQFTALDSSDRTNIVALSGNPNVGGAFIPYTEFDLTALGANVSLDGSWDVQGFPLSEWKHIATNGRDQFVRIVFRGWLFPLGHRAIVIEISDRILYPDIAHPQRWSNAVMQSQVFIRVLQPIKTYPAPYQLYPSDWPFTSVEMKTIITPSLGHPSGVAVGVPGTPVPNAPNQQLVLVQDINLNNVQWTYEMVDAAGRKSTVTSPLCFLFTQGSANNETYGSEYDSVNLEAMAAAYNASAFQPNCLASLSGEIIQYAPEGSGKPGSTSHPTSQLTLVAATPISDPVAQVVNPGTSEPGTDTLFQLGQPAFYPAIGQARVNLPAANGLSRSSFSDGVGTGVGIQYYPDFVQNGLGAGSVYMALSSYKASPSSTTLQFPGDAVGGLATPNIQLSGLSAAKGLVSGDLETFANQGYLDPSDYFPAALTGTSSPQLLGGLLLSQVLGQIVEPGDPGTRAIPTIVNQLDPSTGDRTITYTMVATTVVWPDTGNPVEAVFVPVDANGQPTTGTMNLTAVVTISPNGASTYTVTGTASPFTINIMAENSTLWFIQIPINSMTFTTRSGKKPDIQVQVGQITFEGALNFVNALEQFLEDLGGSGFKVDVSPTGITAGFSISLPDISLGMVDLSGLGMSAAVDVPFTGAPATATFSFASQQNPFTVTVSMFGGSGYITLVLGMNSVQQVTASIEFEGNFELNIYIASGGISLAAGIYYNYGATTGLQLTGFVKLQGSIECLGIISVSCELDLSLTYQEQGTQSWVSGTASFTCSIHVLFFTIPISFTVHKQFSGSGQAPQAQPALRSRGPKHANASQAEHALSRLFDGGSFSETVTPPDFEDFINSASVWADYAGAFAG